MTRQALTATAMALSLGLTASAHANLVINSGFETENVVGDVPIPPPPGWAITGDGVVIDTVFPSTGMYDIAFAALSTDPNAGVLYQVLAMTPDQSYQLKFAVLDEAGLTSDQLIVTFGGFSATILGNQAAPPGNLPSFYTSEAFSIPGSDITSISTLLTFKGLNIPVGGIAWNLDDVSVASIPEPGTLWLLGPTLVALAFSRRAAGRKGG